MTINHTNSFCSIHIWLFFIILVWVFFKIILILRFKKFEFNIKLFWVNTYYYIRILLCVTMFKCVCIHSDSVAGISLTLALTIIVFWIRSTFNEKSDTLVFRWSKQCCLNSFSWNTFNISVVFVLATLTDWHRFPVDMFFNFENC